MLIPSQNPTVSKIDEGSFYYSTTGSEQMICADILTRVLGLQAIADDMVAKLQMASAQGVSEADTALAAIKNIPLTSLTIS